MTLAWQPQVPQDTKGEGKLQTNQEQHRAALTDGQTAILAGAP